MIKAVIFDIGGVMIKYPMNEIYEDVGKKFKISKGKVRKEYEKIEPLAFIGKITKRELWPRLARKLEIKDINALRKLWLNSLKKHGPLNPRVVKIIKNVKKQGYKVATISDVPTIHEQLHRKLGHYKIFDRVFLSDRIGIRKPDIRIYRYAIEKLKVKPGECVFIDDKLENVLGAGKAGMKAILFKNANQLEKDLKKYL